MRGTPFHVRVRRRFEDRPDGVRADWTFYDFDAWARTTLNKRTAARTLELLQEGDFDAAAGFLWDLGAPVR